MARNPLVPTLDQTTTSDSVVSIFDPRTLNPWGTRQQAERPDVHFGQFRMDRSPSWAPVANWYFFVVNLTDDGGAYLVEPNLITFLETGYPTSPQRISNPPSPHQRADVSQNQTSASEQPSPSVEVLNWIEKATGLPKTRIHRLFGVSRTTLYDWWDGEGITDGHRRHLLAVYDVLRRAQRNYPTPERLAMWLDTPAGVEAATPAELLEAGRFDRARMLAVVTPSPGLAPVPAWVRRRTPEVWADGAESQQEAFSVDDPEPPRRGRSEA